MSCTWSSVTDASYYEVHRCQADNTYDCLFDWNYSRTGVTYGTSMNLSTPTCGYYVHAKIKACNGQGCSELSDSDSVYTGTCWSW